MSLATREPVRTAAVQPSPWLAAWSLAQREWVRFIRQRNRVVGALGQPILLWLLFGAGLSDSFQLRTAEATGISYREYFFPGTLVLILLFTAIFATISLIEDRREGFLQSVLVAPVPRWSLVLGKISGGAAVAVAQGLIFLLLGLTLDLPTTLLSCVQLVAFVILVSLMLTALGFLIAWRMDSTQGFHAIMSLVLLPMWLLSGAFFPSSSGWLYWIAMFNPVTYAVAGVRRLLYTSGVEAIWSGLPSLEVCWLVTALVTAGLFWQCCLIARTRTTGDML